MIEWMIFIVAVISSGCVCWFIRGAIADWEINTHREFLDRHGLRNSFEQYRTIKINNSLKD